jgi:Asp-tRNA(Asn)/Glu-tRNA(Gln) amidotransferase A subunit family amidase
MDSGLHTLTAVAGTALVRAGKLTAGEWLEACLTRIRAVEPQVHAWRYLDEAQARAGAQALDRRDWRSWTPEPLLAGAPLGVKDVFNTEDMPTAMGSDLWHGFTPGNDARVVSRARLLGALMTGKTVTAEFATHAPGRTVNPRDPDRIAGTSSTGSAAAVLCGMVPAALGTQTAGSIIRPSSYLGVVGFKPSFGLIPRTGVLKTADTLDTIGWTTRSVADARLLLDALRAQGKNYPNIERGLARAAAKRDRSRPWRLALALPPTWDDAADFARAALTDWAAALGRRDDVEVVELDLRRSFAEAHQTHRVIYHRQLAYYFKKELGAPDNVSPIFRAVTEDGLSFSAEDYFAALKTQTMLEHRLDEVLDGFDALVTLSVNGEAPRCDDERGEPADSCLIWSLCGAPAVNLPLFTGPSGLPFGAQLAAPRYGDYTLLELAQALFPDTVPVFTPAATAS